MMAALSSKKFRLARISLYYKQNEIGGQRTKYKKKKRGTETGCEL